MAVGQRNVGNNEGFTYAGDGLAYRHANVEDKRGACPPHSGKCAVVIVEANDGCTGTGYVKTKEYDASQNMVSESIESVSGLAPGERAVVAVPTLSENGINCRVSSVDCL